MDRETGLDEPEPQPVALVFVHGIGQQQQGQTLLAWSEPIAQVANRFSLEDGQAGAAIPVSDLVDDGPSRIEMTVPLTSGEHRVLLSEARWADKFLPLSASETTGWIRSFVMRATVRVVRHVARMRHPTFASLLGLLTRTAPSQLTLDFGYIMRMVVFFLALVLVLVRLLLIVAVVGVALLVVAPVLLVVATVGLSLLSWARRLPMVGPRATRLVTALISTVGDAGAWTTRPVRAAAMREVVQAEITDARDRVGQSGRVIVVAHSQGAAVSYDALFGNDPLAARVDVLVTVGAAVALLGRPRFEDSARPLAPVATWVACTHRPQWINAWAMWDPVSSGPIGDTAQAARDRWRECFQAGVTESRERTRAEELAAENRRRRALALNPEMNDFGLQLAAAGMDGPRIDAELERRGIVVPPIELNPDDGSNHERGDGWGAVPGLARPRALRPGPEEWPLHNRASLISDHTTYTSNVAELIEPLTRLALDLPASTSTSTLAGQDTSDRPAAPNAADVSAGEKAARGSVYAVRYLALSRSLAAGCALVLVSYVADLLSGSGWLDSLAALLSRLDEDAGAAAGAVIAASPRSLVELSVLTAALFLLLLVAGQVTWRPLRAAVTWRRATVRSGLMFGTSLVAETCLLSWWAVTEAGKWDISEDLLATVVVLMLLVLAGPAMSVLPSRAPAWLVEQPAVDEPETPTDTREVAAAATTRASTRRVRRRDRHLD